MSLIESYLSNRYQKVTLNKIDMNQNSSDWIKLTSGVHQGSILGPLLFLIYINDLPTIRQNNNKIVLFADDTSIITTDTDRADYMQNVNTSFKKINNWLEDNRLNLNFEKTHYIEFRIKKKLDTNVKIQYNHKTITQIPDTTFLGLIIDETLNWTQQTNYICNKMATAAYALSFVKQSLPRETLKLIYYAYVHPILRYGIIFWGNCSSAHNVFMMQKRIIKIIANAGPRDSCRLIFRNMKIFTIYSQHVYSLVIFTLNNNLFTTNSEVHEYNTRNKANLHPSISNLTKYKNGSYLMGIKVFNHLPQTLKELVYKQKQFRNSLKRFLYQHSFYTSKEYFEFTESL
jgi:hypothetical protein